MRLSPAFGLALVAALSQGCVTLGKYHDLEQKQAALQKQSDDLKSQLDEIHREASNLQSDLGTAKQTNDALSQSKSALETQKSSLEQTQASLEVKTAQLETKTAELETRTQELEQAKAALEADKAALEKEARDKQAQYDAVTGDLQKELNDGQLKITQYRNMLTLDVADRILFDSGKADLKSDGKAVLKRVGEALSKGDKVIRVVGHTDNLPLAAGAAFASNWDLSTARATTVVRFLQEHAGIDPRRLVAEGCGEFMPVAPNDTPENRQKNRRIEITLIDRSLVDGSAPAGAQAAAQALSPSAQGTPTLPR